PEEQSSLTKRQGFGQPPVALRVPRIEKNKARERSFDRIDHMPLNVSLESLSVTRPRAAFCLPSAKLLGVVARTPQVAPVCTRPGTLGIRGKCQDYGSRIGTQIQEERPYTCQLARPRRNPF